MGRNNADFQESALYHGSTHPFKAGDVILPDREVSASDHNPNIPRSNAVIAYATDSPRRALGFAETKAHLELGPQHRDKAKVYKVEPVDKDDVKKDILEKASERKNTPPVHYFTSKKGFRVLGEHDGEK